MEPSSRKVVKRSPARTVRLLNLPDLQSKAIECESSFERDFAKIASVFFATRSIEHQPFRISLSKGTYTPDFLVRFQDGSATIVEVKPSSHIERHAEKLDEALVKINGAGMPFLVVDETTIEPDGIAKQARLIRRYAKASFPLDECARALDVVRRHPGVTLGDLTRVHGFSKPLVLHLISHRQMSCRTRLSAADAVELVDASPIQQDFSHAIQFGNWLGVAPRQAHA
jgi:hypothetical protein